MVYDGTRVHHMLMFVSEGVLYAGVPVHQVLLIDVVSFA